MGECEPLWFTTEWSAVRRDDDAEDVTQQMKPANSSFNKPLIYALFTLFSQCSRSCGKGLQMREVRCLAPDRKHSHECDLSTKPEQEQICNTIPCSPQVAGVCESVTTIYMYACMYGVSFSFYHITSPPTDENCRDRRPNCMVVVQARMCVYTYYKTACCASCTQSAQRAKRH